MAQRLKEDITTRSVGTTGEGTVIGPRAEDIEQVQEEIKEVSKPPVTKLLLNQLQQKHFQSNHQ